MTPWPLEAALAARRRDEARSALALGRALAAAAQARRALDAARGPRDGGGAAEGPWTAAHLAAAASRAVRARATLARAEAALAAAKRDVAHRTRFHIARWSRRAALDARRGAWEGERRRTAEAAREAERDGLAAVALLRGRARGRQG